MIHNFSAGPSILPQEVFKQASEAILNFNNSGLSILEISHRSADFDAVMDEITALLHEMTGLGDDYAILYLSGGASTQFFMLAMNLLEEGKKAAYVDTGSWSSKAIKEARMFGEVEVLASSKEANYTYIPKGYTIPADVEYLHLTSNNTIYGSQFQKFPDSPVPVICDMSSDIFSRQLDFSKFDMIYAGAQKNLGPAGVTIVIMKKDMLGRVSRQMPTMLDYRTHEKKGSMFNTPPVFPIFVSMLNLRWLKANGGLAWIEQRNRQKASLLYDEVDRNSLFKGTVVAEDRSVMNPTFVAINPEHEAGFLQICKAEGISGLKGHRSVGGFRASMYNAMGVESVELLVKLMQEFEDKNG